MTPIRSYFPTIVYVFWFCAIDLTIISFKTKQEDVGVYQQQCNTNSYVQLHWGLLDVLLEYVKTVWNRLSAHILL